jgi:hypothetical protein
MPSSLRSNVSPSASGRANVELPSMKVLSIFCCSVDSALRACLFADTRSRVSGKVSVVWPSWPAKPTPATVKPTVLAFLVLLGFCALAERCCSAFALPWAPGASGFLACAAAGDGECGDRGGDGGLLQVQGGSPERMGHGLLAACIGHRRTAP